VDVGEVYRGLLVSELLGGGLEALGEQALIVAVALADLGAVASVVKRGARRRRPVPP
jgi:hypothetical protein